MISNDHPRDVKYVFYMCGVIGFLVVSTINFSLENLIDDYSTCNLLICQIIKLPYLELFFKESLLLSKKILECLNLNF